jgi:DNA primase
VAGRIRREDIDGLRSQADIVTVVSDHTQLKRAGSRMKGLCPFHSEKTPSFTVDPGQGFWHCFGCGEGGDVYDFLQRIQGLSFTEAVEQLARRTGYTLHYEDLTPGQRRRLGERSRLVEINQAALELFQQWLYTEQGEVARDYLKSRGFGKADADRFALGYAPNTWESLVRELKSRGFGIDELVKVGLAAQNDRGGVRDRFRGRLIFPVFDASGDPIGFGGRVLPGLDYGDFEPPKYYNSPETPLYRKTRVLYGLSNARTDMAATGEVLICEGYTDVMALHQAGFGNAVATCGTAVGAEHFRVLSRYVNRVVLAFDSDAAGVKAAEKAWEQASEVDREASATGTAAGFRVRVLVLPDDADPAEYVQREGVEALRDRVDEATPVVPFLLRSHLAMADTSTETGRTAALRDAVGLLGQEPDPDLRRAWARTEIADVLGVSEEWVQQTAARAGVTLDRHQGAAVPTRVRRTDHGRVARVTHERAARERAVLRVALQRPEWLPDAWYQLATDDFHHPRAQAVHRAVDEAGGAGVPLEAVLEAARDDDERRLVRALALEEPDAPDTAEGVRQQVGTMLADRVEAELAEVVDELSRVNPSTDPGRFRELNRRSFELEQRRRELRTVDHAESSGA